MLELLHLWNVLIRDYILSVRVYLTTKTILLNCFYWEFVYSAAHRNILYSKVSIWKCFSYMKYAFHSLFAPSDPRGHGFNKLAYELCQKAFMQIACEFQLILQHTKGCGWPILIIWILTVFFMKITIFDESHCSIPLCLRLDMIILHRTVRQILY